MPISATPSWIKVRRLRLADGMPLAILTNYLPRRYGITAEDLQNAVSTTACGQSA